MKYLRIANPGYADPNALTVLGVSTSRYSNLSLIGQFGSGSKHSIALLLRRNLQPIIMIDRLKLNFGTETLKVKGADYNQVYIRYDGTDLDGTQRRKKEKLSWTTEMGTLDWNHTNMACREFVANALDGAISNGDTIEDVVVELVDTPRAKSGWTQVFIPASAAVLKFYDELHKRFLHFRNKHLLHQTIIPKVEKDSNECLIYKRGVLVAVIEKKSLFDYNLDDLYLDESRNAREWAVKYGIAKVLRKANKKYLSQYMRALIDNLSYYECSLDLSELYCDDNFTNDEKTLVTENWQEAWTSNVGNNAVAALSSNRDYVERKGFSPVVVRPELTTVLQSYNIRTYHDTLNAMEKSGRSIVEPTEEMVSVCTDLWNTISRYGMTNNRTFPPLKSFQELMTSGSQCFGECTKDGIFLHQELSGTTLKKVALEELAHWITGATDNSRDFQDWAFRFAVSAYNELQ